MSKVTDVEVSEFPECFLFFYIYLLNGGPKRTKVRYTLLSASPGSVDAGVNIGRFQNVAKSAAGSVAENQ